MIYYKLDDRENAREYLQQAIELNTDNDYRERAEIKLRELELAYE
jgi:Tfp pilus assembly protein PilF